MHILTHMHILIYIVIDPEKYNESLKKGNRSLCHDAFKGALIVCLYRDNPRFAPAFQLMNLLLDVDESLARWRFRHVLMVQRMIGSKQGTGGSSGYHYLRSTTSDRYRIFLDVANLSTFIIPQHSLEEIDL